MSQATPPIPTTAVVGFGGVPVATRRRARAVARITTQVIAATIVWVQLWLLLWAVVPVLLGWQPTVIVSGSMQPLVRIGDVVLIQSDPDPDRLTVGSIITFDDPDLPGRLVTHRLVAIHDDGMLTTRGDANADADPTPVHRDAVQGMGRVLVPSVGLPMAWAARGEGYALGIWLAVSITALVYSTGTHRRSRGATDASPDGEEPDRGEDDETPEPAATVVAAADAPRTPRPRLRPTKRVVTSLLILAAGLSTVDLGTSSAAFAAVTSTASNSWASDSSFTCARNPITTSANEDATILESDPKGKYGDTPILRVRSAPADNARALTAFNLPNTPGGCSLFRVRLRVQVSSGVAGRTLNVQAVGKWTEKSVAWDRRPTGFGPIVSAASATSGVIEWDITSLLVNDIKDGVAITDAAENAGGGPFTQVFRSRESGNGPVLIFEYRAA